MTFLTRLLSSPIPSSKSILVFLVLTEFQTLYDSLYCDMIASELVKAFSLLMVPCRMLIIVIFIFLIRFYYIFFQIDNLLLFLIQMLFTSLLITLYLTDVLRVDFLDQSVRGQC